LQILYRIINIYFILTTILIPRKEKITSTHHTRFFQLLERR